MLDFISELEIVGNRWQKSKEISHDSSGPGRDNRAVCFLVIIDIIVVNLPEFIRERILPPIEIVDTEVPAASPFPAFIGIFPSD
jgi:hypothetical protein